MTRNVYSGVGTLLSTTSPDEGTTQYVYARDGRIRFSQSARQKLEGKFSYSNYDAVGRVVESGEYGGGGRVFESQLTDAPAGNSILGLVEDRTPSGGLSASNCTQRNLVQYDLPATDAPRPQEFVLGAVARTSNATTTTWYSYDALGRLAWLAQALPGVGTKIVDYTYDFNGNVLEVAYQKGQPDAFYHHYQYDADQRLLAVATSPDGLTKTPQARYDYYLHGPLKRTELAGNLQGIDYAYTVQGWLKSINSAARGLDPGQDAPRANSFYKDLFGLTLDYFAGDYRSAAYRPAAPAVAGVPTRYDGLVRAAGWFAAGSPEQRLHSYEYDAKSQLTEAHYGTVTGNVFAPAGAGGHGLEEGQLRYDAHGNLSHLRRTNLAGAATDDFTYQYRDNTNQLAAVKNPAGAAVLDYDYDADGQMTRQRDEQGQQYFSYDVSGKVTGAYRDAARQQPVAQYAYDDRGFRVSKASYSAAGQLATTTYYVRDAAGNVLSLYEQAPGQPLRRTEVPLYGAGRLGTLTRLDDGTDDARYELNDQLGNARVVLHRPQTTRYTATMEPGAASQEQADFTNVAVTRYAAAGHNGSAAVARLGLGSGQQTGPAKTLQVAKGDTITFTAYAWLTAVVAGASTSTSPKNPPLVLPTPQPNAAPPAAPGADGAPTKRSGLPTVGISVALPIGGPDDAAPQGGGAPGIARLHYRVLDEQGTVLLDDYQTANGAAPATWQTLQVGLRLPQAGSVQLSVETNGAAGPTVYFDDVAVEQTGGLIVQEQHQYAFGAPLPGLSYSVGSTRYRHGYQGQFADKDEETGFDSFELRLYNSRIGRWTAPDPYGQFDSPYVGMGNDPVNGVDPDGGFFGPGLGYGLVGHAPKAANALSIISPVIREGLSIAQGVKSGLSRPPKPATTSLSLTEAHYTSHGVSSSGEYVFNGQAVKYSFDPRSTPSRHMAVSFRFWNLFEEGIANMFGQTREPQQYSTAPIIGLPGGAGAAATEIIFKDITIQGSRYANRAVGLTYREFRQGLLSSGYRSTLAGGGKVEIFENATKRYVMRTYSKSGPATVDVYEAVEGKFQQLYKFRLK